MHVILEEIVEKINQHLRDGKNAEDSYATLAEFYSPEAINAAMILIKSRACRMKSVNLNS
jgi:hypothetical protein